MCIRHTACRVMKCMQAEAAAASAKSDKEQDDVVVAAAPTSEAHAKDCIEMHFLHCICMSLWFTLE